MNFEVENGFLGLMRDIILKLVEIAHDDEMVRSIFGMCFEFFLWKSHSFFKMIRMGRRLVANPHHGFLYNPQQKETRVSFLLEGVHRTFFLDRVLTSGIVKLTLLVSQFEKIAFFRVGVARESDVHSIMSGCLGSSEGGKGVAFCLRSPATYPYGCYFYNNDGSRTTLPLKGISQMPIEAEVDSNKHIMCFAHGAPGIRPYAVVNIPTKIMLGFTGCTKGLTVHVQSMRSLLKPTLTPSSYPFERILWAEVPKNKPKRQKIRFSS